MQAPESRTPQDEAEEPHAPGPSASPAGRAAGRARIRRWLPIGVAALVAVLAVPLMARLARPSPRERFRRELGAKGELLNKTLRERYGGGRSKGIFGDFEIYWAAKSAEEHFSQVALDVCCDVAGASPAAFDAWKQAIGQDLGRYRAQAGEHVSAITMLMKDNRIAPNAHMVDGHLCFSIGSSCFVAEKFGPSDIDEWARQVRASCPIGP